MHKIGSGCNSSQKQVRSKEIVDELQKAVTWALFQST